jgi:putative spermidine/putrescine transport system permease protein
MRRIPFWSWVWFAIGAAYFVLPLYATIDFSLRAQRHTLSLVAYQRALADPQFLKSLWFSFEMAALTIVIGLLLIVPTAYWVHLRMPHLRPVVEFLTLMPFVIPAIVLVFGLIRTYARPMVLWGVPLVPSLTNNTWGLNMLLVAGYVVLSLPYLYRAVDNGLRAMDVRSLTEAAQSLGASWPTTLWNVIFPNLRAALLSGALLTFAIVVGELTIARFLSRPAFAPYLADLSYNKAYEPAALTVVSFALTWGAMGLIQYLTRGTQGQVAGAH